MSTPRRATRRRTTKETDISLRLVIDGKGKTSVNTGIPFLDHMLTLMGTHGLLDLQIKAKGDLEIDVHHTNEDIGIVLGEALLEAIDGGRGIRRYGWAYVPMDEALARVALDLSGRAKLVIRDHRTAAKRKLVGSGTAYQWADAEHWLESFVRAGKITMHVDIFSGDEFHHTCEAVFKALGRALRQALERDARLGGAVPSSKGRLG